MGRQARLRRTRRDAPVRASLLERLLALLDWFTQAPFSADRLVRRRQRKLRSQVPFLIVASAVAGADRTEW